MRSAPYPDWPSLDESDVDAVTAVVRGGQVGGYPEPGPRAAEFAAGFAAYQGAAHGIVMANGTVTMEVALKALGVGWGDEVIIPALTFAATPYAAMAAGALPVFVDVEPDALDDRPGPGRGGRSRRGRGRSCPSTSASRWPTWTGSWRSRGATTCSSSRTARTPTASAGASRAPARIGDFGSFSHQSTKILTAGEGGTLTTQDERLARLAHSLIDCGRPKDAAETEYTFGANYRLGELACALLVNGLRRFPAQQERRAALGEHFERLAADLPGVTIKHRDPRITRWSFYRYIFEIDPEAFAGATNEQVADALEAEGVPAEVQYPPMSRYDLFQPSLSRLPVAVEYADRLDPARMSFPVAEAAGERTAVYLNESIFRSDEAGVEHAVEAIAKVQRLAADIAARV